jgi:HSP20 family molecular chaperone IbpA
MNSNINITTKGNTALTSQPRQEFYTIPAFPRFPTFPTIMDSGTWDKMFSEAFADFDKYFGTNQVVPCNVAQIKDEKGNVTATEIQYALAGYNKLEIDDNHLCLTIEKQEEAEDSNKVYLRKGFSSRRIQTTYNMSGYDKENIDASFENGVLKLTLPVENKKPTMKKIEIK